MASNRDTVLATIAERTGVEVEVIPGEEEAASRLGRPLRAHRTARTLAVLDTGGGSTQLTFGHDGSVDERFSVNVGAVRYTERFGLHDAVSPEVLAEACAAIAADLERLDGRPPLTRSWAWGARSPASPRCRSVSTYDPERVQGAVLERAEIDRQIEQYRSTGTEERRAIVGLQPSGPR